MPADSITQEQIKDGVRQLLSHATMLHEQYKQGTREYTMISAREGLYTLGYNEDQADRIIDYIAAEGFSYCLDPRIPSKEYGRPAYSVCCWGADQLASRLYCVSTS